MKRESRIVDRSDQVDSLTQRHLPLVDLLVDTRSELMELAVASGLKALQAMLEDDRTAICGQRSISISWSVRPRAPAPCRVRSCSGAEKWGFVGRACGRTARKSRCRHFRRWPARIR
jgi:hypothetical protein